MISLELSCLVCLFLSAYFSSAEMAFVSTSKLKIRELADRGSQGAKQILKLYDHPHQFLASLLIGNNIVNISATAIFTVIIQTRFGIANEWVAAALIAPVLIIFSEMVPKDYGRLASYQFLTRNAFFLSGFSKIFHYPVVFILKLVDFFLSPLGPAVHKSIFVDEEEFRSLIEESAHSGIVTHHEKQLIDTILDFERIHVDSAMMPVDRIPKVAITGKVGDVKDLARRTGAKMVLVYEELPSIIVGMIYVFDILFEEKDAEGLKNFLRSPIFLVKNTSIEKAFLTLQEKRQSFACVTDFHGEVVGAVPIERLLAI